MGLYWGGFSALWQLGRTSTTTCDGNGLLLIHWQFEEPVRRLECLIDDFLRHPVVHGVEESDIRTGIADGLPHGDLGFHIITLHGPEVDNRNFLKWRLLGLKTC